MAEHVRKQIRDAVVAVLQAAPAAAWGGRVFPSRRMALAEADLPAVCVYTTEEDSALDAGRHLRRSVSLVIEAVIQDNAALDDSLDALATAVETRLGATRTLGGLAYDAVLSRSIAALQPVRDAQFKTGSVVLTYDVTYRTPVDDPTMNSI